MSSELHILLCNTPIASEAIECITKYSVLLCRVMKTFEAENLYLVISSTKEKLL